MTFEEARAQFPVLERFAYLNAGTFGPMAQSVFDAIVAEQRRGLVDGRINRAAFERYMEQRPLVRAEFAKVLGVPIENVAVPLASVGLGSRNRNSPEGKRSLPVFQTIVTLVASNVTAGRKFESLKP